jgi:hypothetical protein
MKRKLLIIPVLLLAIAGCKKSYLETKPSDAVTQQKALGTTASLATAINGTYQTMFAFSPDGVNTRHDNYGQKSWDLASDLMGQDMVVHTAGYGWYNPDYQYTEWQTPVQNRRSDEAWYFYYDIIHQANNILFNIDAATGAQAEKDRLKGEALGLRAYGYFYLINYFQQTYKGNESKPGVPLMLQESDYVNGGAKRSTVQQVYDQIKKDLVAAETLLTGKTRPDKTHIDLGVIKGFQARVALLQEDWATAATKANQARQSYTLMSQSQYAARTGFSSITNPEWMWGSLITSDKATIYASFWSHIDITNQGYAYLGTQKKITKYLYDLIPAGDVRKTVFKTPGTGTSSNPDYNQLKFQVPTPGNWTGDYLYMRASEMYLIEAEALVRQNQDAQARTVLEQMVQARNPAYSASSFSGTDLLNEILLQRRIELWGEGFSLIDIKRLKAGLNRPKGPGNHGSPNLDPSVYTLPDADPKFLMRIPDRELNNNPFLTSADQNP